MLRTLINTGTRNFGNHLGFNRAFTLSQSGDTSARAVVARSHYSLDEEFRRFDFNSNGSILPALSFDQDRENEEKWNVSGCMMAFMAGTAALLWMNKIAQAEEIEKKEEVEEVSNDRVTVVTKENYQSVIDRLGQDDPRLKSLKIGYVLTENELVILLDALQSNTELNYISWHKNQIRYSTMKEIEEELAINRYYGLLLMAGHALISIHFGFF